jgi:hypothetical protein
MMYDTIVNTINISSVHQSDITTYEYISFI